MSGMNLIPDDEYRELMQAAERLVEFEHWLRCEYDAAFTIWKASTGGLHERTFAELQSLQRVARHFLTGQDDLVPLFDERLIYFAQHIDFLKRMEERDV